MSEKSTELQPDTDGWQRFVDGSGYLYRTSLLEVVLEPETDGEDPERLAYVSRIHFGSRVMERAEPVEGLQEARLQALSDARGVLEAASRKILCGLRKAARASVEQARKEQGNAV